jgi:hypothetical protein
VGKVWPENKTAEKLLLFRRTLLLMGCRQAAASRHEGS